MNKNQKSANKKTTSAKPAETRKIETVTAAQLAKKDEAVKGNKFLTVGQARETREMLLRLRERMTGQINFLATDNLSRSDEDSEVNYRSEEQGTDNFDRDFALNRVSLDQEILFEIDEALNRLALGTYGICDSCGQGIEKARLKAVPYSRMCVACKSRTESSQKNFKAFESTTVFNSTDKTANEPGAEEE